jgi:hypothetical protein
MKEGFGSGRPKNIGILRIRICDTVRYIKYTVFYVKIQFCVTAEFALHRIWIRNGLPPWIWIRIEINADPQL